MRSYFGNPRSNFNQSWSNLVKGYFCNYGSQFIKLFNLTFDQDKLI